MIVSQAVEDDYKRLGIHRQGLIVSQKATMENISMTYKIKLTCIENNVYFMSYTSFDSRNKKYDELRKAMVDAVNGVVDHDNGFVRLPSIISVEKI